MEHLPDFGLFKTTKKPGKSEFKEKDKFQEVSLKHIWWRRIHLIHKSKKLKKSKLSGKAANWGKCLKPKSLLTSVMLTLMNCCQGFLHLAWYAHPFFVPFYTLPRAAHVDWKMERWPLLWKMWLSPPLYQVGAIDEVMHPGSPMLKGP